MVEGWIKLHRALLEWEWYDDIPSKVLFIHLLLKCNHADGNYRGRKVLRGQRWTSIGHLAKETGLTVKQIRAAIEKLESTGEIGTQGASDGTMVTVCKYDCYQEMQKQVGKQKGEQKASEGQAIGQAKGNKQEEQEQLQEEIEGKEFVGVPPPLTNENETITLIEPQKKENTGRGNFTAFSPPEVDDVVICFASTMAALGLPNDAYGGAEKLGNDFHNYYHSQGWKKANDLQITEWRPLIPPWLAKEKSYAAKSLKPNNQQPPQKPERSWNKKP
jgi:DNA-binding transcriptional MerR regulator